MGTPSEEGTNQKQLDESIVVDRHQILCGHGLYTVEVIKQGDRFRATLVPANKHSRAKDTSDEAKFRDELERGAGIGDTIEQAAALLRVHINCTLRPDLHRRS